LELSYVAKKITTRIEPGDKLVMELPVVALWPDMGKVTVTIAGTRFTFAEDNPEIPDVLKATKEKAARGQKRVASVPTSRLTRRADTSAYELPELS
jgi:hypothetical protein